MSNPLVKFVKKTAGRDRGRRIGVVIAKQVYNEVLFGWSLLNYKAGDKWDRSYALALAEIRLSNYQDLVKQLLSGNIPQSLHKELLSMVGRAEAYFKNPAYELLHTLDGHPHLQSFNLSYEVKENA